jgi:hypothetical protein
MAAAIDDLAKETAAAEAAMQLASKRSKQLELPLVEKKINEGQPEINIEEDPTVKPITDTFVEPDVDVPYIDVSGERPKLTVIKGEGKKQPRPVKKNTFDILDEAEKDIPIQDKPIPDNELVDPDAQKLLEETDQLAPLRTAGRMREPGKNTREMLADIIAQREMTAPRTATAEGAMLAAPGSTRTPINKVPDETTLIDIEPFAGGVAAAKPAVVPGSFIGITDKGPTETARATQAIQALRTRAKQKKPDIADDELPEVEYLPDENTFVVRDPMLPAAESYLTLDENGILSGQWQTEYVRPMRGGKKQIQKTDLFTSTDALDATMYTFGDRVKGLKSIWTDRPGLTTNTDVFQKKVHELMDTGMPQKQAELEAAFETNTARKMQKYGFTEAIPGEIDYVIENGKPIYNSVEFTFSKPTQQSAIDLAREIASSTPVRKNIDKTTMLDVEPITGSAAQSPLSKVVGDIESKQVDYPEISADEIEEVDRFHPIFEEAKRSADKFDADEGYKLALERFNPVYKFEKADGLALVQSGLVPLQVPVRGMPGIEKPSKWIDPEQDFYNVTSKLGEGVFGRAHIVIDETGAKKVAKISAPATYDEDMPANLRHERNVALEMQKLRKNSTKEDQKYLRHFPVIEKVMPNPLDPKNGFIFVMKELRPMNDYELSLLFKGRRFAEDEVLNLEEPYLGPDFDFPTSWRAREALTDADYENMPQNVRKFYNALEWLADTHNIKWDDLHDGNVMIDPVTNEYVALDMGNFSLKGKVPPGMPSKGPSTRTQQKAAEQAAIERGRKSSSSSELALEIAKQGLREIKTGKPRGMAILPFGGKGKPKQLPEKTQSTQTTAMVPGLSKQEIELAAREPSIMERLGKAGRSLQGELTIDEFRAERKILEDELNFAQQKLDMAIADAEIRAAERAQNAAYLKLNAFKQDYPDVDDIWQLVNDLDKRILAINKRYNRGDHLTSKQAADALAIDAESITFEEVAIAEKIRDISARYPELKNELPELSGKLPEVEIPAFAESRGLMGRLEEMLGLKKRR